MYIKEHKCFKRENSLVNYEISVENMIGIHNYWASQEKENCLWFQKPKSHMQSD